MDETVFTAVEAEGTGGVYIGSGFTRYRDRTMQGIARLRSDGTAE